MSKRSCVGAETNRGTGRIRRLVLVLFLLLAAWWAASHREARTGDRLSSFVERVTDGDTIVVRVNGVRQRVRLLGLDTPETVKANTPVQFYGPEASAFTKRELAGRQVWLEYDAEVLDRYRRQLAYVWTTRPPDVVDEAAVRRDMFNARLLLGGYARIMNIKPNTRYAELFAKFEAEARRAKRGLWARER